MEVPAEFGEECVVSDVVAGEEVGAVRVEWPGGLSRELGRASWIAIVFDVVHENRPGSVEIVIGCEN